MRFAEIGAGLDEEALQQFLGGLLAMECRYVAKWRIGTKTQSTGPLVGSGNMKPLKNLRPRIVGIKAAHRR
jgi:hypothetical protein